MGIWMKIGLGYLIVMNLAGLISMAVDKQKAKKHEWRISERTLFLIAILGGSLGSFVGMQLFRHKTKHKRFVIGIPLILLAQGILLALFCYQEQSKETRRTDFVMGTVVSEVVYGNDSEVVTDLIHEQLIVLDTQQLSWRESESTVTFLNEQLSTGKGIQLYAKEKEWLTTALKLCRDSEGALDITIHPVIDIWGIEGDFPRVPEEEEIEKALETVGYENLHIGEDGSLYADNSQVSLDLGSIGKGIAADEIRNTLNNQEIRGAVISIGGTVLVYGKKPGDYEWQIGIRDPRGEQGTVFGTLTMAEDGVVSTSGDYEQYFIEQDKRYHHIFDPATGYPADSGLCSVTVISEQGIISDGLSTACFVLGYEKSLPLLEQYDAEAIFVTTEKEVYVTDGIRNSFEIKNPDYVLQP